MEFPLQNLPTNTLRSKLEDKMCGNIAGVYPNDEQVHGTVVSRNAGAIPGQLNGMHSAKRKSTSGRRLTTVSASERSGSGPTSMVEDDKVSGGPVDKEDNVDCGSPNQRFQKETQPFADYSEDENEEELLRSEGKTALAVRFEEVVDVENPMGIEEITLAEETAKRKERRQAQAMREKKGDRRKKEGPPRNFLLVDEYTKKPYSVGVGDWRKELMLLSHNLDPAIGNIKQQPKDAVAEIAEWIQHTWEYSSPIKFEYVREVIARGVTLRRADLWRKIRNNEPKPEGLSDRSWRILQRQLDSPATIRKSESCQKANANRFNFGRTSPLGEVGVRERLRRRLRRSPDPEEICFEMARNKGYGGQYRRKKEHMNVMHDPGVVRNLAMQLPSIEDPTDNSYCSTSSPNDKDTYEVNVGDNKDHDVLSSGASTRKIGREVVQAFSTVEVAQHPLVLKMMEHLEALEGRHFASVEGRSAAATKSSSPKAVQQGVQTARDHTSVAEVQEVGGNDENEGPKERLTCGHLKKRGKHD